MRRLVLRLLGMFPSRTWLPVLAWAAAIMAVSSIPSPTIGPPLFPGCDKIAHFIEYSILGIALRRWTAGDLLSSGARAAARETRAAARPKGGHGIAAWLLAGGLAFAALDEAHQRFIPGRTVSIWDFAANGCGLLVGFFVAWPMLAVWISRGESGAVKRQ